MNSPTDLSAVGLFVGSGQALAGAGPVGVWLGYILMSTIVYAMMVALGEMASLYPVAGAFTHYGARFVDPALGFAQGVNYWYSYAITLPTEVVSATIVISYWDTKTPAAAYIIVCLVPIWFINLWGARAYGEAEFWFSSIKVITIVGLLILGVILMAGGGPNHDPIGFRYWRNPGPFNYMTIDGSSGAFIGGSWGQFLAFWNVFVQAAFSFIGTEIIATTLGEAENPRKSVPRAIKTVFYRLAFFYIGGIFIISVLVPYTDPRLLRPEANAVASPFVIAIVDAGINGLPSVVNAVLLISAWSAGNSDLYAASRTFYALALQHQMPGIFRKCTKRGLPIYCVGITGIFGVLAFLNTGGEAAVTAFGWLYNISSTTGVITWWYVSFMKLTSIELIILSPGVSSCRTSDSTMVSRNKVSPERDSRIELPSNPGSHGTGSSSSPSSSSSTGSRLSSVVTGALPASSSPTSPCSSLPSAGAVGRSSRRPKWSNLSRSTLTWEGGKSMRWRKGTLRGSSLPLGIRRLSPFCSRHPLREGEGTVNVEVNEESSFCRESLHLVLGVHLRP